MNMIIEYGNLADEFLEKHNLKYGNEDITIFRNGNLYIEITVESPNNWTNSFRIDIEDLPNKDNFIKEMEEEFCRMVSCLNADDSFNDLWTKDFARENNFTAKGFIEMLDADMEFLENIKEKVNV